MLCLIALGWVLPDIRKSGRLPKYNPGRRPTFSIKDWEYLCEQMANELVERKLSELKKWISEIKRKRNPCKSDQDSLDACICLLCAMHLVERKDCLMIGNTDTGYMVVPAEVGLSRELEECCRKTDRDPSSWIKPFSFNTV